MLLLAGEAGIGKSRLVREMSAHAAEHGMQVFQGNCFEPDRTLPYGPLLDALRAVLRDYPAEALANELGTHAPALAQLVPELDAVLPPTSARPRLDSEQEKRHLFEALAQCFLRLAAQHPLLLVAEDVHWSDDSSLEFFLYLARRIEAQPLVLALTYRSDEVHPALAHFLASLDRERLATELALNPLTREDEGCDAAGHLRPASLRAHRLSRHALYLDRGQPLLPRRGAARTAHGGRDRYRWLTAGTASRRKTCISHAPYKTRCGGA